MNRTRELAKAAIKDVVSTPKDGYVLWPQEDQNMTLLTEKLREYEVESPVRLWAMNIGYKPIGEIMIGDGPFNVCIPLEGSPFLHADRRIDERIETTTEYVMMEGDHLATLSHVDQQAAEQAMGTIERLHMRLANDMIIERKSSNAQTYHVAFTDVELLPEA